MGSPSKLPPGSIEKEVQSKSLQRFQERHGAFELADAAVNVLGDVLIAGGMDGLLKRPLSPENKKFSLKALDDDANGNLFGCREEQLTPGRRRGSGERPHRFSMPDHQTYPCFNSSEQKDH